MFLSRYKSTFFSVVLAFASLGLFSAETPLHIRGMSPYDMAVDQWQEKVFSRVDAERQKLARLYDSRVNKQILRIISNYNTGLGEKYIKQVPELIISESKKYGYDPLFLTALIITESSFFNRARSHQGALGLMQILPRTGFAMATETQIEWKGDGTLFDPVVNIALGSYYLDKLIKRFGDLTLALEAYNHGPSQLARYLRKGYRPHRYSLKVLKKYKKLKSMSA